MARTSRFSTLVVRNASQRLPALGASRMSSMDATVSRGTRRGSAADDAVERCVGTLPRTLGRRGTRDQVCPRRCLGMEGHGEARQLSQRSDVVCAVRLMGCSEIRGWRQIAHCWMHRCYRGYSVRWKKCSCAAERHCASRRDREGGVWTPRGRGLS